MTQKTTDKSFKRLSRSETDKMIAGVAGGIAAYFDLDAAIIRIAFIVITLLGGSGVIAYLILWLVLPLETDPAKDPQDQIKANAKEIKTKANLLAQETRTGSARSIWGLFLVGLGVLFLLQNFGLAKIIDWGRLWPIMLIVLGFAILSRK
jgi:phage shock protein C